ncbi:hypothetical protein QYF36_002646 [Acer negundo]|nr:hypothetical protein QYF36_002646 [Acer negundo]
MQKKKWIFNHETNQVQELGRGSPAKARGSRSLEVGAPREAGFTEQRSPPAPGSGRITGRCYLGPLRLNELAQ